MFQEIFFRQFFILQGFEIELGHGQDRFPQVFNGVEVLEGQGERIQRGRLRAPT